MKLDDTGTNPAIITKTFEINPNLINTPKTLLDLAIQYRNKKNILDKKEQELDKPEGNSKSHF